MEKRKVAIIVAGGKGERMGEKIPKQFLEIHKKPILMYVLELFYKFDNKTSLILVLPAEQIPYWQELCKEKGFSIPHEITSGGPTRFHSVKNGLALVKHPSLIAVHDGVRPLANTAVLANCFSKAEESGAAIPVVDLVDSIRKITSTNSHSCERAAYRLVQTPQVFDSELLKKAYEQDFSSDFTDDASVVESIGVKIQLVPGNRENIKITSKDDLKIASLFLVPD